MSNRLKSNARERLGRPKRATAPKKRVQDARSKIIQKKRNTVVDARDILAKMAQKQDARSKIDKLRATRRGGGSNTSSVKMIGPNILKKTDRNGKISLVTKNKPAGSNLGLAIQEQLGMVKRSPVKKVAPPAPRRPAFSPMPALRKTILNDMDFTEPFHSPLVGRMYDGTLYKWRKEVPVAHPASQMISALGTRKMYRDLENEWRAVPLVKPVRLGPTNYVDLDAMDEDEDMPMAPMTPRQQNISFQSTPRVSTIHSRLDNSPPGSESHGIFSQAKTKVVVPVGHRIVVSNLQATVTQDDIKELFEDIGQLLTARLVRPGVAEVIYKNLKDAQKAVDTYHNRQLDGQPMKCLLVNKRPVNQPTAPALAKEATQSVRKSTNGASQVNALVPDISTIHKVLFQRK